MEGKEKGLVFDTILSAPGMTDLVKLDFKVNRKLVLLMVEVLERGLKVKGEGISESCDAELKKELHEFMTTSLERADLIALYTKLKQFN